MDGHALRWWVRRHGMRGCPDCDECTVVVAHESRKGAILRVFMPDPSGADVPITPARVELLVRKALARGWVPGQGRGEFPPVNDLPPEP